MVTLLVARSIRMEIQLPRDVAALYIDPLHFLALVARLLGDEDGEHCIDAVADFIHRFDDAHSTCHCRRP